MASKSQMILTPSLVVHARRRVRNGVPLSDVARDLGVRYGTAYAAVTGSNWSDVEVEPPVSSDEMQALAAQRLTRACTNCGEQRPIKARGLCHACYQYLRRRGRHRPAPTSIRMGKQIVASESQVRAWHQLHTAGVSLATIASEHAPFGPVTLRQRFDELGLPVFDHQRKLRASLVRQARHLHYREGVPVSVLAARFDANYSTLYAAVRWRTWRAAGGPGAPVEDESAPCSECGLLTAHKSGRCDFCRAGR